MRLSNKILLGFFGFIFLYLTAAFAELRLTGEPNFFSEENSKSETVNITGVRYVIIKGIKKDINVISSDRSELEVRSKSGNLLPQLTYKVLNDTLTLSYFDAEENKPVMFSVFLPKESLRGITIDNAAANVHGFESDILEVMQTSANFSMTQCTIGKMVVTSSHSSLVMSMTTLDTLSAEAKSSQLNFHAPIGFARGSINNGTFLYMKEVEGIELKKDVSSKLSIY
jgi:hypothetical protein